MHHHASRRILMRHVDFPPIPGHDSRLQRENPLDRGVILAAWQRFTPSSQATGPTPDYVNNEIVRRGVVAATFCSPSCGSVVTVRFSDMVPRQAGRALDARLGSCSDWARL